MAELIRRFSQGGPSPRGPRNHVNAPGVGEPAVKVLQGVRGVGGVVVRGNDLGLTGEYLGDDRGLPEPDRVAERQNAGQLRFRLGGGGRGEQRQEGSRVSHGGCGV
jgi:hypothetical protein